MSLIASLGSISKSGQALATKASQQSVGSAKVTFIFLISEKYPAVIPTPLSTTETMELLSSINP
jgi:hypothetical protein